MSNCITDNVNVINALSSDAKAIANHDVSEKFSGNVFKALAQIAIDSNCTTSEEFRRVLRKTRSYGNQLQEHNTYEKEGKQIHTKKVEYNGYKWDVTKENKYFYFLTRIGWSYNSGLRCIRKIDLKTRKTKVYNDK